MGPVTSVERLGWSPVKGTSWLSAERLELDGDGIEGDRLWSPVTPDLRCVRATDLPWLAGLRVEPTELPGPDDLLLDGRERTVLYYDRRFSALVHGGEVARRLSEAAGQELLLARTTGRRGFIWSSPVSLLLRSELDDLPLDTDRYRPNIVLDDRAEPIRPEPGMRLRLGPVVLHVEAPLERCLVIDHHPVTGRRDQRLLGRLRPGVLLGWGCRVLAPGSLALGELEAALLPG
ncbi:MOSC domain-containing protein [Luteococcus peritonei]|uniref:MOSC domain-containing protein n=1 Tax=Luteococcus peritonei TaxID=88874 RepID=A0ABW4RRD2_9ACTN